MGNPFQIFLERHPLEFHHLVSTHELILCAIWYLFFILQQQAIGELHEGFLLNFSFLLAASLRNQITWDTNNSEPFLDVDVELNLVLEVVHIILYNFRIYY